MCPRITITIFKYTQQINVFFSGGGRPPSAVRTGGGGAGGRYAASNQGNEMNIPNDGASDSLSSTSEAEVGGPPGVGANAQAMNTGDIGDNGKPLSFARIASLNLEKQAIGQKPPRNVGEGTLVPSSGSGNDLGKNSVDLFLVKIRYHVC